jgi:acyl carrier protein
MSTAEQTLAQQNEEKLRQVFAEVLNLPLSEITDAIAYDQTKGWDSIAHMNLVAALDARFDIMLDTDDIVDMSSYGKAKLILRRYEVSL